MARARAEELSGPRWAVWDRPACGVRVRTGWAAERVWVGGLPGWGLGWVKFVFFFFLPLFYF